MILTIFMIVTMLLLAIFMSHNVTLKIEHKKRILRILLLLIGVQIFLVILIIKGSLVGKILFCLLMVALLNYFIRKLSFCPKCTTLIDETSLGKVVKICPNCGYPLKK